MTRIPVGRSFLPVSQVAYDEIASKLEAAGFSHALHDAGYFDLAIDMRGLVLIKERKYEPNSQVQ